MTESSRRRVKLYVLNDERQWDDRGTGHVSAMVSPVSNNGTIGCQASGDDVSASVGNNSEAETCVSLLVISENDGSCLLESRIQPDTAYQKQQETLIVWSEGENSDLALSFQERTGCDDIWAKICNVQGKDPSVEITQELVDEVEDSEEMDSSSPTGSFSIIPGGNSSDYSFSALSNLFELPPCELTKLSEMLEMFHNYSTLRTQREQLANSILERGGGVFLQQLVEVFRCAEATGDLPALQKFHDLAKQLLSLNHPGLYGELFSPAVLMDIIGMLEYTPSGRRQHRQFLKDCTSFNDICALQDSELIDKIHQTYRVQYIQECCLSPPSPLEDNTLNYLTTFVLQNKSNITRQLLQNEALMRRLFAQICDSEESSLHSSAAFNNTSPQTWSVKKAGNLLRSRDKMFELSNRSSDEGDDEEEEDDYDEIACLDKKSKLVSNPENVENNPINSDQNSVKSKDKRCNLVFFLRELCQLCNSLQVPDKENLLLQLLQVGNGVFPHNSVGSSSLLNHSTVSPNTSLSGLSIHHPHHLFSTSGQFSPSASPILGGSQLIDNLSFKASGGLMAVLRFLLTHDEVELRHAAIDILQILVETHVNIVRDFMFREDVGVNGTLMFNLLIDQLFRDKDPEATYAMNISIMLRALIDPEAFLPNGFNQMSEKNEFVAFLLKHVMPVLVMPLQSNSHSEMLRNDNYHTAQIRFYVLDILTFCVESHSHAMKAFFRQRQIFTKVLCFLKSKYSFLVLAVIRMLRHVLSLKDEFYNRSFIPCNILPSLVQLFRANGHRYNLVNSALLEFFDFIQTESISCLIQELGRLGLLHELAQEVSYVATFRLLRDRYDLIRSSHSQHHAGMSSIVSRNAAPPYVNLSAMSGPSSLLLAASSTSTSSNSSSNSSGNMTSFSGSGAVSYNSHAALQLAHSSSNCTATTASIVCDVVTGNLSTLHANYAGSLQASSVEVTAAHQTSSQQPIKVDVNNSGDNAVCDSSTSTVANETTKILNADSSRHETSHSPQSSARMRRDPRSLDEDEERWFDNEDDEEEECEQADLEDDEDSCPAEPEHNPAAADPNPIRSRREAVFEVDKRPGFWFHKDSTSKASMDSRRSPGRVASNDVSSSKIRFSTSILSSAANLTCVDDNVESSSSSSSTSKRRLEAAETSHKADPVVTSTVLLCKRSRVDEAFQNTSPASSEDSTDTNNHLDSIHSSPQSTGLVDYSDEEDEEEEEDLEPTEPQLATEKRSMSKALSVHKHVVVTLSECDKSHQNIAFPASPSVSITKS